MVALTLSWIIVGLWLEFGWIWRCAGGQAVSELSGGEACEGLDGLRTAYGYNFWEVAFKIGVINSPVFWEYYSKDSLR